MGAAATDFPLSSSSSVLIILNELPSSFPERKKEAIPESDLAMEEGEEQSLNSLSEEAIPESFTCCVCLDLLYKPVVLSCGHVSCFWCVHKSMSWQRDSNCPICRHPYNHFPNICQMLHFLLLKMYPTVYSKREEQILEEEKKSGFFSPRIDYSHYNHLMGPTNSLTSSLDVDSHLDTCSVKEACSNVKKTEDISGIQNENGRETKTLTVDGKTLLQSKPTGNCEHVSIVDVQCVACKQLLFHPVVLHCGHVYCKTCLKSATDTVLSCQVCQSLHPRGFPKVCLQFDQFLQCQFPKEYALRRDAVQLKQVEVKIPCHTAYATSSSKEDSQGDQLPWWDDPQSKYHAGVGCDSCGMVPIMGDRYRCIDCVEKIGFDLCGDCYKTPSKLPGRFNQQHTPEHKFERLQATTNLDIMLTRGIMLNRVNRRLRIGSRTSNYNEASNIPENLFAATFVSGFDEEGGTQMSHSEEDENEDHEVGDEDRASNYNEASNIPENLFATTSVFDFDEQGGTHMSNNEEDENEDDHEDEDETIYI